MKFKDKPTGLHESWEDKIYIECGVYEDLRDGRFCPDNVLEEQSDIDKVNETMKVIEEFAEGLENQEYFEYI